jgi:hypothetical protein
VHGAFDVQQDFASRLRRKGFQLVEIPEKNAEYIL